jgi:type VI secretion system protein ImpC
MEFDFQFTTPRSRAAVPADEQRPMRILVMGDFSGRDNRGLRESGSALAQRLTAAVDVDNFQKLMSRFSPQLHLPLGDAGADMTINVTQLDDFHPDHLYRTLEVFQALRETRERLLDPATFADAAAELRRAAGVQSAPAAETQTPQEAPSGSDESDASTLERILGAKPASPTPARQTALQDEISRMIQSVVAPHIVPKADPLQQVYVDSVDEAITAQMRRILHHPAFQALEAAWRGVHWLITSLETDEDLKVYLLDVSKQELAADVDSAGRDLQKSGLYQLLVDRDVQTLGGQPWSLLVGDYTFGTSPEDVRLLAALGALASQAGGPFLAAAAAEVLGCSSLVETPDPTSWTPVEADAQDRWQALRNSPAACWLGLALPRVLLRLPYGKGSDEIDQFEFEELPDPREHEAFLWGNPATACALMMGMSFVESGWSMEPGDLLELDDLPAYTYREEDEAKLLPSSEVCLTERAADAILRQGIMPFLSYKNRGAVRVARFQSLADPPTVLSGAWSGKGPGRPG